MYDDVLPVTGGAALMIGSHSLDLPWLVTLAAATLLLGVLVYRLATRHQRRAGAE